MELTKDMLPFEGKTRDGRKAWVLDVDEGFWSGVTEDASDGYIPRCWRSGGTHAHTPHLEIIAPWSEPRKGEGWVNVYGPPVVHEVVGIVLSSPYRCRADADAAASLVSNKRIACVPFTWTEGEGLD